MRKYFGGAAVACVATISVVALSGCSASLEDAMSGAETTMGDRFGESTRAREGQAHDPKGESGSSGAGTGRGTGGADDSSSGRPGAQEKGSPAGEGARPAGHEGLWFDSEPAGPWDRYVWKSQKYIGKGGDIPKLGPGTADKAFWGLPDLCSRQMQLRMKDVGFEFAEDTLRDQGMWGCWYLEDETDLFSFPSQALMVYSTSDSSYRRSRIEPNMNRPNENQKFVQLSSDKGAQSCGSVRPVNGGRLLGLIPVEKDDELELLAICTRAAAYSQIAYNITYH